MTRNYCLKESYRHNATPQYYADVVEYGKVWQPEVYNLAFETAVVHNAEYIIDIGSGSGEKLKKFERKFKVISVDFGKNKEIIQKNIKGTSKNFSFLEVFR
jgi:hypothetical protein